MDNIIFEGDWGGQIYLTVPKSLIVVTEQRLDDLHAELDRIAWPTNEGDGWQRSVVADEVGFVSGGMGGGAVFRDQIWMHEDFKTRPGVEQRVRELLELPASVQIVYG